MSEESKKKELDSNAFNNFRWSRANDPVARIFFDSVSHLSPEAQKEILENQKKILSIADKMEECLRKILSTEQGKSQFESALRKRTKVNG
jgi:hypothetical protein